MTSYPFVPINTAASTSPAAALSTPGRSRNRTVLLASADISLRQRLRFALTGLRWQVLEAPGGAEAWVAAQDAQIEALLIDPWLPDLDVSEFLRDFHRDHPQVDVLMTDGVDAVDSPRSPYRQELLYALRCSQDGDTAAWNTAPTMDGTDRTERIHAVEGLDGIAALAALERTEEAKRPPWQAGPHPVAAVSSHLQAFSQTETLARTGAAAGLQASSATAPVQGQSTLGSREPDSVSRPSSTGPAESRPTAAGERIPSLIGVSPVMLEVSRRIRLVAERTTPVLIEGPTGSGKELVAEALHSLSKRSKKPFSAINCAAIPEALLEAELFGHTRGAFTGAVQGRTGRIEAADGGTLFLDEIGEMPLALQSKLLRFFESGEVQRIGDNDTIKVDVRLIAATHQPLAEDAQNGRFRSDLYYRLAVFLIRTPALVEHMEDLPQLVTHFLEKMGRRTPVKRIDGSAMERLQQHHWPGNVRELDHVLERASILVGEATTITAAEIDFGSSLMNLN